MNRTFSEVKLFQVKPDKLEEFEALAATIAAEQKELEGCLDIKYMKRFYIFDEIPSGPREITKIVRCVKYFSFWEFETKEQYARATVWFFEHYEKKLAKLLIMPFDINCGYSV